MQPVVTSPVNGIRGCYICGSWFSSPRYPTPHTPRDPTKSGSFLWAQVRAGREKTFRIRFGRGSVVSVQQRFKPLFQLLWCRDSHACQSFCKLLAVAGGEVKQLRIGVHQLLIKALLIFGQCHIQSPVRGRASVLTIYLSL